MNSKMYLHVDLDAFFASVEVLDNPELKGKPVIVGGLPGERRSVVSTCSYEARKYGVHSAMPVNIAFELCPNAIFIHGRMGRYHEKSQEVMSVFREFSPDVLQMSIDEAFIDITGTEMLFGTPENLAKLLKKKVREKTGLTVSVGIATNRYVAKIASGLKKPDGLCYVPEGHEEDFMLSLPLDKLWGIGTKSRERLNACGIFTIPEIHAISETALKELFGEASGTFLYKSVRGMDVEHFGDETKSHSMSAERTFCFDLTDIYSIETELLHLSYDVMFRVLREKVNSKTVCLKIRYEDFTTVTVTESSSRIVSSIEDLFERARRLFNKKYERGRGIRLLGLGLQNVNDGLESEQGELFDFGEKKQRSVEKTVLKLHQKSPGTKLKKARQFITPLLALFFLIRSIIPIYAETIQGQQGDIEFEVEGSWEALLSGTASVFIGDTAPVLSLKPPVFSQKADVLLWFMYNNHWYFDASVATYTDTNLLAAGYMGDGTVKEVRIGTDIGTENISPGIKIDLGGNEWNAGASLHLDSIQTQTKTWNGSTELISSSIALEDYRKGFLFSVIDSTATSQITALYVENSSGSWQDDKGRRYRKLTPGQYLLLPSKGLVYLETPVTGTVIAEISNRNEIESRLPQFLSAVFNWFGDRGSESTFSMMGISNADDTDPFFTAVSDGAQTVTGMYLSKSGFFSPFQVSSLYNAPSSFENDVSTDTSKLAADYTDSFLMETGTSLIQLYASGYDTSDYTLPEVRFPAAQSYPWIYLPSSGTVAGKTASIYTTSTSHSDELLIGSKAVENSIQVRKNGLPVPAVYDRSTGKVTPSVPYGANDTITISWNEYTSQAENMSLTMSSYFNASPIPSITLAGNASSTLYLDPQSRSLTSAADEEPYTQAAFKAGWEHSSGNITYSASNTSSAKALLSSDSQKAKLISFSGTGNADAWLIDGAAKSDTVPVLSVRPGALPSQAIPVLSTYAEDSFNVESVRRKDISGYTVTLSGVLSRNNLEPHWFSASLPLSSGAQVLASAHEFTITVTDLAKISSDYDVYLQLGPGNNSDITPTWLISSSSRDVLNPFKPMENGPQKVKIFLTDSDRMKLKDNYDMKLIFVNRSATENTEVKLSVTLENAAISGISSNVHVINAQGTSYAMPLSVSENTLPEPFPDETVKASYAERISWNIDDADTGCIIQTERASTKMSLSRWQKATLLLYIPENSPAVDISVHLLENDDGELTSRETFTLTKEELDSGKGTWKVITKEISSDAIISSVQMDINAKPAGESGTACVWFGGVYLSDSVSALDVQNELAASVNWTYGDWSAGLNATATGLFSILPSLSETDFMSDVSAQLTSPFIHFSGSGSFNMKQSSLISGYYKAESQPEFLNGIISLSDEYRYIRNKETEKRLDTASFSLLPLQVPFSVKASVETDRQDSFVSGKVILSGDYTISKSATSISLNCNQTKTPASQFNYLGSKDAQKRSETAVFSETLLIAEGVFAPVLEIQGKAYAEKDKISRTGSFAQKLTLPFTINSDRFSISYARESLTEYHPSFLASSYMDDIKVWCNSFSPHLETLKIIPVYDLFSDDTISRIEKAAQADSSVIRNSYGSLLDVSWARPLRGDNFDLIIPNSVSFSSNRNLSHAGLNTLDKKLTSISATFTAFNCFGSSSAKPVFKWYDQDEFQYSARYTTGTEQKTELSFFGTFYLENDATCTAFYSGMITYTRKKANTVQISWTRPGLLMGKNTSRTTSGTFAVNKDVSPAQDSTTANISHRAVVSINEIFSVNCSAEVSSLFKNVTTLSVTLSIGGKMTF